jgi:hypothetical protein
VDQAAVLRRSVHRWFAEHGREAVVAGDAAQVDGTFGLANLARVCATRPTQAWPELVDAHLDALLTATENKLDLQALPRETVLGQVMARLWPVDTVGIDSAAGYRRVAAGLAETLVLDAATHVRTIDSGQAQRFGAAALKEAAYANLATGAYEHRAVAAGGYCFDVVRSESTYAGSKLLVMPALLSELYGDLDVDRGVLVGVADRSILIVHRLGTGRREDAGELLAAFVAARHAQAPWPLSPHVYCWRDGKLELATAGQASASSRPDVEATQLGAVLIRSGLLPPPTGAVGDLDGDELGIELTPVPAESRDMMAIALRFCRDHIRDGVQQTGSFPPFVLMNATNNLDLVLVSSETVTGRQDPFTYLHQFMGGKNRFAVMGVDAAETVPTKGKPAKCAIVQVEHRAGLSQRLRIPYRQLAPGKVHFSGPLDQRIPPDWPAWRSALRQPDLS